MQTLISDYKKLVPVELPYRGRQMYMHTFDLSSPEMPEGFEDYVVPVMILCRAAGAGWGIAHMTVDERIIKPGSSHRRPKPHVDGCFNPEKMQWGHDNRWQHYCNDVGGEAIARMPVIVAASEIGCRAWRGNFEADPASDGDLSHMQLGDGEVLRANWGYLLSPDCVHESMVHPHALLRTFLRIALPVDFNF